MLNRICWLHSKITKDQCIVIVFNGYGNRTKIVKEDKLTKDEHSITITHNDGSISIINTDYVVKCYTAHREVYL